MKHRRQPRPRPANLDWCALSGNRIGRQVMVGALGLGLYAVVQAATLVIIARWIGFWAV